MPRDVRPYIDRVPEYDIRDGVVCVSFGDWSLYMPLRVFRAGTSRANAMLRTYDKAGDVVPLRGR